MDISSLLIGKLGGFVLEEAVDFAAKNTKQLLSAEGKAVSKPYSINNSYEHWLKPESFEDILNNIDRTEAKFSIKDLKLNESQISQILELRDFALHEGKKSFELEIEDISGATQKYRIDTQSLELTPMIHS